MRLKWTVEYLDVQPLIPLNSNNFPADQLVVYQGLYGVPSYVIWYARPYPEKPRQFKVSSMFNLTLHTSSTAAPFIETFKVQSIIFDVTKKMWRIFAIPGRWELLSTINNIQYFEYPKETCGIEVIKDVLGTTLPLCNIFYDKDELEKYSLINYKYIAFDRSTTVLDIISKICMENRWEWYFAHDNLYVSPSLWLDPKLLVGGKGTYVTGIAKEKEHVKDAIDWDFRTLTIDATGAEPMTVFNRGRVIWVKYMLGEDIGDMMTIMCQNITRKTSHSYPYNHIDEINFYKKLTGIAKELSWRRMDRTYREMPVIAGRIFGKVNDSNDYQTPKFSGEMKKKTKNWETRNYFNEDDYANRKYIPRGTYLEKARITTPYAGDGVGMLFPQEKDQHRLLFSPNGERDMPLVGPGFFAEGEQIPVRAREDDFRLQLPGDSAIYYNTQTKTLYIAPKDTIVIQYGGMAATDTSPAITKKSITIDSDSILIADDNGVAKVEIENNKVTVFGGQEVQVRAANVKVSGGDVKMVGGAVNINGVKMVQGGLIKCTAVLTEGGVLPPNIL